MTNPPDQTKIITAALITLEFATISGVRLGFGYNSVVRSPSAADLYRFPFINDSDLSATGNSNDPISVLTSMCGTQADGSPAWVSPQDQAYWLAMGMSITAFDLLSVTAVALVSFKDDGIFISLIANAVAQLPPKVEGWGEVVLLYAELDMIAEINFSQGSFRTEAALAPASFLLVPQCRLQGGFGIAYWFEKSPFAEIGSFPLAATTLRSRRRLTTPSRHGLASPLRLATTSMSRECPTLP